jgi:hypothetical protein
LVAEKREAVPHISASLGSFAALRMTPSEKQEQQQEQPRELEQLKMPSNGEG